MLEGDTKASPLPFYFLCPPFIEKKSHQGLPAAERSFPVMTHEYVRLYVKKKKKRKCFTHSNKNLSSAVSDLDVLVVYEAAHNGDVGMALCGADPRSLLHLVPHAAWTVFAPPRVVG